MSPLRYSPLAWRSFSLVFNPRMRLTVGRIRVAGETDSLHDDRPLLLVANHVSWWDGFIFREVQERVRPGGAFHVPMLARELGSRPFLKLLGGLELEPDAPQSFRRLLRDLREMRDSDPALTVLFFPQGRIWPSHRRPLGFADGVRLMARALSPVTVVPAGLHLEPGTRPASTAFVSLGRGISVDEGQEVASEALERAVEAELDKTLAFLSAFGEDAENNWPEMGTALPDPVSPHRTTT